MFVVCTLLFVVGCCLTCVVSFVYFVLCLLVVDCSVSFGVGALLVVLGCCCLWLVGVASLFVARVACRLFDACWLFFVCFCLVCVDCYCFFVIVARSLFVVRCLLVVVRCSLFVVCCLLLFV